MMCDNQSKWKSRTTVYLGRSVFFWQKSYQKRLFIFPSNFLRIITIVLILMCYVLPQTDLENSHFDSFGNFQCQFNFVVVFWWNYDKYQKLLPTLTLANSLCCICMSLIVDYKAVIMVENKSLLMKKYV